MINSSLCSIVNLLILDARAFVYVTQHIANGYDLLFFLILEVLLMDTRVLVV